MFQNLTSRIILPCQCWMTRMMKWCMGKSYQCVWFIQKLCFMGVLLQKSQIVKLAEVKCFFFAVYNHICNFASHDCHIQSSYNQACYSYVNVYCCCSTFIFCNKTCHHKYQLSTGKCVCVCGGGGVCWVYPVNAFNLVVMKMILQH